MAQIDPNIALSVRPLQIESPVNQMAAIAQLQGLQQQQQMNALKMREYQRGVQQKNALALIHADPNIKIGSPEYLARVSQEAPDLYEGVATRVLQQADLAEKTASRKLSEQKLREEIRLKKLEQLTTAQKDIAQFNSIEEVIADIQRKKDAGLLPDEYAQHILQGLPTDPNQFGDWKNRTLMSLVSAEKQLELNKPMVVAPGGRLVSPTGKELFAAPDREKESDLARLQRERGEIAAKDPDDPRIKNYDAAIAKLVSPPEHMSDLARLQNERAAIAKENPNDPRLKDYDARISKLVNPAEHLSDLARKQSELEELEAQLIKDPNNAKLKQRIKEYKDDIRKDTQWKPPTIVMQAPTLSVPAIDMAADRFLTDGTLPTGISKPNRDAIINRASVLAKEKGLSADRITQLEVTANKQALAQLSKTETMVGSFEKLFVKNADLALLLGKKVDNTGVPLLQKYINAGYRASGSSPDLKALDTAIEAVASEYAKIVSGSMGNTAVAQGEKKRIRELINSQLTPQDLIAVINTMKIETENRMKGFKEQRAELIKSMRSSTTAPATKPNAPVPYTDAEKERRYQEWKAKQGGR